MLSAYTLGLIATFVSLFLMNSAQPALLYLVPFTLVPVFVVSLIRSKSQKNFFAFANDDLGLML
jgi:hypothetical protein